MEFWLFLLGLFILWVIWALISHVVQQIAENRKYRKILKESMPKVGHANLLAYERSWQRLQTLFETNYKGERVVLRDNNGKSINICPKCGGYRTVVRRRKPFLGCSNYPRCVTYGDYNSIFNLEI